MATNRRRRRRDLQPALTPAVAWWLENGGYLDHEEAARLGIAGPAALQTWLLEGSDNSFDRGPRPLMTRRRLREIGYGPEIDALIEAGKTVPDDYFTRSSANV